MNDNTLPKSRRINESWDVSSKKTQKSLCASLMVYGTLKRGYWNYDRYCRNAIDIRPATTWGRLYALPAGYPALEIPQEHILAHGTDGPLADAATQAHIAGELASMSDRPGPSGDWDLIHGEVITFADPTRDLPPIDHLEGFSAGRSSLYHRVLTYARFITEFSPVWAYIMQSPSGGVRLRHGWWGEQPTPSHRVKLTHIG